MAEIIWTDHALDDVNEIADYIAEDSLKYAIITIESFFERTQILKKNLQSGRMVPEMQEENIRELIEGNYRIIYKIISETRIEILTVIHGARLLKL
jgi:addiction module RelE/StbE family toxin